MSPTVCQISAFGLAALCLCALASASSLKQTGQPYEIREDGGVFPYTPECKSDEKLVFGQPPECEQTCCPNQMPCFRVFYQDLVACFCKDGLVRNKATGECVKKQDCPKTPADSCKSQ